MVPANLEKETMMTMTHSDKLEYEWWKRPLPDTLVHKNNYVLNEAELTVYVALLEEQSAMVGKELREAQKNLSAVTKKGMYKSYICGQNIIPRCTTLCNVLEFVLARGKSMLALTNMLVECTRKRVEAKEAAERG
jgi:hypothetical protein